jgi:putative heme-binding domain-containing protein
VAAGETDRAKVVQRYLAAEKLKGDVERGKVAVLKAGCIACHRLGNVGVEVGPDLATVANKPAVQLIEAIFDPNRALEDRYAMMEVSCVDGTTVSGLLGAETPGGIVLKQAGGAEQVVKRSNVKAVKNTKLSLMPNGLEALLTVQDVADILAAMRQK